MKSLLGSTAVYLLLPLAAFAADLPKRTAAPVAPVAAPATWTGFYFGANAGLAFGRFDVDGDKYKSSTWNHDYEASLHRTGLAFGIQGGYNYQINNIVLGVEADLSGMPWMKKTGENASGKAVDGRINALASLRGRVGFAFDKTLVYATGGVGMVSTTLNDPHMGAIDKSKTVGVFGLGIEHKVTSAISLGLEGLMITKANTTETNAKATRRATFGAGNTSIVRAKVNFAF